MLEYTEVDGEIYVSESEESIREKRKKLYQLYLSKSGIPEFYWNIDFEHYEGDKQNKEYLHLKLYADNCHKKEFDHIHLFIHGLHSTQKSALAYNIGKQAIRNGMKVKSILAGTLIDKLMKLQGFNYIEEIYQEVKELKDCDLLIVDDFGDGSKTLAWKGESKNLIIGAWDTFLREILASKTKLVMTSNYDLHFIQEYYGKSMFELLDRNFYCLHLLESIKKTRQYNVSKVFENIYQEDIKRRS